MKKFSGRHRKLVLIPLIIFALLAVGCGKSDDSVDTTGAPEIPPKSTFVIDFDEFTSMTTAAASADSAAYNMQLLGFSGADTSSPPPAVKGTVLRGNWLLAASKVGFWSLLLTAGLILPTAAFVESFNHAPEEQTDGSWLWPYDVTVTSDTYTAELYGSFVDNEVHWEMYITKEGSYEDFNWYSGVSNLPVTEGTWTLQKNPDEPHPWIGIEWHRNPTEGTGDIKYTNIEPDNDGNGGYIHYGTTTDETYDAFYNIYNKVTDTLSEIEWNRTTKEGRIKVGDGDWQYWDSNLYDTDEP